VSEGWDGTATCFCFSCYQSWDKLHDRRHEFELKSELESDEELETVDDETTADVDSSQEGSDGSEEIVEVEEEAGKGDRRE
jgi:hypothetical protein